jgi:hypothetical protein
MGNRVGLIFRLGQEIALRLAEAGRENDVRRTARAYALVYVAHCERGLYA